MAIGNLFIAIFGLRSSIVKSVFDCHLSGVVYGLWMTKHIKSEEMSVCLVAHYSGLRFFKYLSI